MSIVTSGLGTPINYGSGLTPTEELLKQLGEQSFLRFWIHANPYVRPGEELCDLLVVCGPIVLVFSDKNIKWCPRSSPHDSWSRWYRKAVTKSVRQLRGAVRSLLHLRSPIHKDERCLVHLGIPVPSQDDARVYQIAVVSRDQSLEHPEALTPFIKMDSRLREDCHVQDGAIPFSLGDVEPTEPFVHVMDVAGLRAAITEFSTVSDFASYLDSRESFIREKPGNSSDSEYSMVARFLYSYDDQGNPIAMDRVSPGATKLTREEWDNDQFRTDMAIMSEANRESYVWDGLIEQHARMFEEDSFGFTTLRTVEDGERVVRHMALENRLNRRLLGKSWLEACQIKGRDQAVNIRTVPHSDTDGTTYLFLNISNYQNDPEEVFREKRRKLLQRMMLASLVDVPDSEIVIGLASDLGDIPESYDHAFLDVADNESRQLREDAKEAWEWKKSIFDSMYITKQDERSIPRP